MLLFYLAQWKIILVAFLLYADCNHKNILLIFIENLIFFLFTLAFLLLNCSPRWDSLSKALANTSVRKIIAS